MSDGVMTYEDWLRGCVHHDGRHGYVTLPCEEVLKIADFIERLRADRSKERSEQMTKKEIIEYLYENNVRGDLTIEQMADDLADTPQTEREGE